MEKKLLEVGDVVFRTRRGYSGVEEYKITRVTPTLAISQHYRFKREVMGGYVEEYPYKAFNANTFQLPTPSLQAHLQTQNLRRELKYWFNDEDNQPTLPQLLSIKKTLTLPDEDLAIWIKVEDLDKDNLPVGTYIGINGEFYVGYIELEGEEVSLVYNNGESIMYPTHIISTLALLHIPNHPLPPQKTLTQKEEDRVEWVKVEDLDKDNLPLGDFLGFEDGGDIVVGRLYKITNVDSDSKKTYDIALEYNEGDNAIYPTQVIPIMSLLHLPTKPSTK